MSDVPAAFRKHRQFALRAAALVVCLVFFAQLACGSTQLSLTSDEPPHIVHGYVMLTTGDTWALIDHRHPPLMNVISALPLLLQPERPDARAMPHWGTDFILFVREMWPQLGPVDRLAFVTRYPNMLLGVLLMALVCRWARERFGRAAGLLAIVVMAFDPTMIAHAQLNTTDLAMTFFAFACLYLVLRPGHNRSQRTLIGIGLTLGATMAVKGSGVMLVPVVVVLLVLQVFRANKQTPGARYRVFTIVLLVSCILFVSLLVLWATYGFRLELLSAENALRVPLAAHAGMVRAILGEAARTAFLLGEIREGGWGSYFPVAIALKTPLPILALALWALLSGVFGPRQLPVNGGVRARFGNRGYIDFTFWLFPAFYFVVAVRSGMNIGYRHLLPVFPFVYVVIGRIGRAQGAGSKQQEAGRNQGSESHTPPFLHYASRFTHHVSRFAFYALLIWLIAGTLRVYPFAIAYFNELAGGPRNGYHYLVDSNVDWGQSFIALKDWMEETGTGEVRLSYYTWIDPAAYGVNYRPLPPAQDAPPVLARRFDPDPGVYAISATPLQGVMVADAGMYDWFRHREPVAQPGYGLMVYEVLPRAPDAAWVAQCTSPIAPLTPDAIAAGFGRDDLRVLTFDCAQGWVYPGAGASPGWYALHAGTAFADDVFVQARLAKARLSYEQDKPGRLPPFALYEQDGETPLPAFLPDDPIAFGALTFAGYEILGPQPPSPGATLTLETWWRVEAVPDRPLSLMLHLVGPGGQPVIVGDGLGVPLASWRAGDVIVQRHALPIPPDAPPGAYTPHVGVYWLDTVERWPVASGTQAGADNLTLPPVTVQ